MSNWRMALSEARLDDFLIESNRIEGIHGVSESDRHAADVFLSLDHVTVDDMCTLVSTTQPSAQLRSKPGSNVRVGNHRPPGGGGHIVNSLEFILEYGGNNLNARPYDVHCDYERLHPFTDGNGRSGRLLWLWMMLRTGRAAPLGFLHTWYYQSLSGSRETWPKQP